MSDSGRAEKEEWLQRIWRSFNICLVVLMSGEHDTCRRSEDYSDGYLFFKRQFAARASGSFQKLWQL